MSFIQIQLELMIFTADSLEDKDIIIATTATKTDIDEITKALRCIQ